MMFVTRNGKEVDFVVASGALGWDGNGWPWERPLVKLGVIDPSLFLITTKSLTRFINRGRWWAIQPVRGGVWNNMGLPNKGINWWLKNYKYLYCRGGGYGMGRKLLPYRTLVSIAPENESDAVYMLEECSKYELEGDPNFVGYEVNVSCPNTKKLSFDNIKEIVRTVGGGTSCSYATILKLNYQQAYYSAGFSDKELTELFPYVDAVSLNSAPMPYEKGAYSGKPAQLYNWVTARHLQQDLGFKVIWPSLWEYEDIHRVAEQGAEAVSFGAVHLLRPWAPTRWVNRYLQELKEGHHEI